MLPRFLPTLSHFDVAVWSAGFPLGHLTKYRMQLHLQRQVVQQEPGSILRHLRVPLYVTQNRTKQRHGQLEQVV